MNESAYLLNGRFRCWYCERWATRAYRELSGHHGKHVYVSVCQRHFPTLPGIVEVPVEDLIAVQEVLES